MAVNRKKQGGRLSLLHACRRQAINRTFTHRIVHPHAPAPLAHLLNGETRVKKEILIACLLPGGSKMPNLEPPNGSDSRIERTVAL